MKARVLITGGSGFIGTNMIDFYRDKAELLNIDIAKPRDASQSALWIKADILDYEKLEKLVWDFGPTILIHMAAPTDLDEETNLGLASIIINISCSHLVTYWLNIKPRINLPIPAS